MSNPYSIPAPAGPYSVENAVEGLRYRARIRRKMNEDIETCTRDLVQAGVPFETIGGVLGITGAAVRIKAKRKGWYTPGEPR